MITCTFEADSPKELDLLINAFIESDEVESIRSLQYVSPVFNPSTKKMVFSAQLTYMSDTNMPEF